MMKLYSYIYTSSECVKLPSCAILSLPAEWSDHNFSSGELAVVASQLGYLLILPEVAGCDVLQSLSLSTCYYFSPCRNLPLTVKNSSLKYA